MVAFSKCIKSISVREHPHRASRRETGAGEARAAQRVAFVHVRHARTARIHETRVHTPYEFTVGYLTAPCRVPAPCSRVRGERPLPLVAVPFDSTPMPKPPYPLARPAHPQSANMYKSRVSCALLASDDHRSAGWPQLRTGACTTLEDDTRRKPLLSDLLLRRVQRP